MGNAGRKPSLPPGTASSGNTCDSDRRERKASLGGAAVLAEDGIDVVETGASLPVITDADLVLYDTLGQVQGDGLDLGDFVRDSGAKVVIHSWNLQPDLTSEQSRAASGYRSKVLTGPEIVDGLERIMNGEIPVLTGDHETSVGRVGDWPGRLAGLSPREAEVLL